jgi:hypothetical protein
MYHELNMFNKKFIAYEEVIFVICRMYAYGIMHH